MLPVCDVELTLIKIMAQNLNTYLSGQPTFFVCKYKDCRVSLISETLYLNSSKPIIGCYNGRFHMKKGSKHIIYLNRPLAVIMAVFLLFGIVSCKNNTNEKNQAQTNNSIITSIDNAEQLNKIFEISNERLLILEFYADWCPPCKELAPILEKIAEEKSETVSIYKIDTDRHRELMNSFRVTGIPHVAFVKNKENVFSLTGLYPKTMYLKVIEQYTKPAES
jgi:thioredoxin